MCTMITSDAGVPESRRGKSERYFLSCREIFLTMFLLNLEKYQVLEPSDANAASSKISRKLFLGNRIVEKIYPRLF